MVCACINRLKLEICCFCCKTLDSASHTPGSTQHLKLLKREWTVNLDLLIANIDDVINLEKFLEISGLVSFALAIRSFTVMALLMNLP